MIKKNLKAWKEIEGMMSKINVARPDIKKIHVKSKHFDQLLEGMDDYTANVHKGIGKIFHKDFDIYRI